MRPSGCPGAQGCEQLHRPLCTQNPPHPASSSQPAPLTFSSWLCTCCTMRSRATEFSPPDGRAEKPGQTRAEPSPFQDTRSRCSSQAWQTQRSLTPGHHDVGHLHGGLDVLLKGRLHKLLVLLDDAHDVAPTLHDVALQPPHQTDVGVRVHKHLHVQELKNWEG